MLVPEQGYLVLGDYENVPNSKKCHNVVVNFISEEKTGRANRCLLL